MPATLNPSQTPAPFVWRIASATTPAPALKIFDSTTNQDMSDAAAIAAEDALWNASFSRKPEVLDRLLERAEAQIAAGRTRPIPR